MFKFTTYKEHAKKKFTLTIQWSTSISLLCRESLMPRKKQRKI